MGILNDFSRRGQVDFDLESAIEAWFLDYIQPVGFRDFIIANAVPAPPLYRGMYWWKGDTTIDQVLESWKKGWKTDTAIGDFVAFSEDFDVAKGFSQQGEFGAVLEIHGAKGIRVADYVNMEEHPTAETEKEWLVAEFSGRFKSYDKPYDELIHVVMESA
jgi:hypothetical protein